MEGWRRKGGEGKMGIRRIKRGGEVEWRVGGEGFGRGEEEEEGTMKMRTMYRRRMEGMRRKGGERKMGMRTI
jgi:hypothetical protein